MVRFLTYFIGLAALLFLQEYVFSSINIFGLVNIFAYVMIIFLMPFSVPRAWLLILGFTIGYVVDLMTGSGGLNAICCVWVAYLRSFVSDYTLGREVAVLGLIPSARKGGSSRFFSYILIMCALFAVPYFLLEMMSWVDIGFTAIRILMSSVVTAFVIFVFHLPFSRNG